MKNKNLINFLIVITFLFVIILALFLIAKVFNPIVHVKVNEPIELNYKSKKEVYDIRKKYVKKSPFYYKGYEPSEFVFDGIEDGKPWISNKGCDNRDGKSNLIGPSEEARFIVNPTALIMLDWPFGIPYCDYTFSEIIDETFWPKSITYDKKKKIVYVTYHNIERRKRGEYYTFKGVNAKDFGYYYMFVDLNKSNFVPDFQHPENVSNQVDELQDFIHNGGSCGHESGCNNGSPYQPLLSFYSLSKKAKVKTNNELYIKLWKEMPTSPQDEPDMVQILRIEKM